MQTVSRCVYDHTASTGCGEVSFNSDFKIYPLEIDDRGAVNEAFFSGFGPEKVCQSIERVGNIHIQCHPVNFFAFHWTAPR